MPSLEKRLDALEMATARGFVHLSDADLDKLIATCRALVTAESAGAEGAHHANT